MLSIPQYDSFIQRQYQDVERETKQIKIVIRLDFKFITRFFVKRAIRKINEFLPSQLLKAKGVLADLESREQQLKGRDLGYMIQNMERIIDLNIMVHSLITEDLENFSKELPDAKTWGGILEETIEILYCTLRILKRQTKKANIETSDLALESSKRSLTSLERASYDRRTT